MDSIKAYLPELIAFHEVAKAGGFTQAAENLNLSKSQLSKQVARLETLLSAQLFHRTTRKLALTEEGRNLLHYSESIVKLSEDALTSMKELVNQEGGLIRITAPTTLGDWFAPQLLKVFQEKLPNVKIEIDLSNAKRDLVQDGYDFALRAMDETNPDLIARYIGQIKDVIVASPDYVKKNKLKGLDPNELIDRPVLLSSLKENWNTWKLQKGNKDLVLEVKGNYACTSYQANRFMCLEGLGVARLPFYSVVNDINQKKLIHLYKDYSIGTHPLYLVYSGSGYKTKKQKISKELIWEWIRNQKDVFY
jgi:DNA-binding transcriptional LysR family regulator